MKKFILLLFVLIIVSMLGIFAAEVYIKYSDRIKNEEQLTEDPMAVRAENTYPVKFNQDILRAVVGVSTTPRIKRDFEVFASERGSMGSGVIVNQSGLVLTNHHLIKARPDRVVITFDDGTAREGSVIWSNENLDAAVVKISSGNLTAATLGDTNKLKIGQQIIAVASPYALQFERSAVSGIIGALGRTVQITTDGQPEYMYGLIQTDAKPEGSGGVLISGDEVVGIVTDRPAASDGLSFAIPVNVLKPVIESIEKNGEFSEAYLGIKGFDSSIARYINQDYRLEDGVYVTEAGGPAAAAGVKSGDVIKSINNVELKSMLKLREELYYLKPNQVAKLKIVRDGDTIDIHVRLAKKE